MPEPIINDMDRGWAVAPEEMALLILNVESAISMSTHSPGRLARGRKNGQW